ncbi:MAG: bifunctional alpha,alpha-trehalose-phosphate synthase (UDP-forming)/trehalose-phosphatase [Candidatus Binatia bacterium]|nr:MAG: bifunctional alpha,alpha-trehalose-phosphate synthase (UDP-forming)/trehalose-phosphatase [Candidatus Binatia bacterium]
METRTSQAKSSLVGPAPDRPLVIVSNRLPVTVLRGPRGLEGRRSSGGLVSALEPVLLRHGGRWIGWAGAELRSGEDVWSGDRYEMEAVRLSAAEVNSYYHGFSNRTLWPLFHCFVARTRFNRGEWEAYERVNARFAEAAARSAREIGLVWVHDYHLLLCPQFLRAAEVDVPIAFFLHIPFPPFDIFRLLPWDREVLRGMLGADLVGFHVRNYARNFLDCVEKLLGVRVDRDAMLVEYGERTVRVGAFPIGIDFERFEQIALRAPRPLSPRREKVILGVDRLDYTKGIPERLLAFERLLETHPEHQGKVVFLELAVPSRFEMSEYRQLKRRIDELVGRINGRFATATWSPVRYLYRSVSAERLAALYRDADVALVTPLRDGMNLVAKEFVACQVSHPGVLVLSYLAGSAETMHEAIQVNPYDIDATAEALHRALTMDEAERRSRMVALRRRERQYDLGAWLDDFLRAATAGPATLAPPSEQDFDRWLRPFLSRYPLVLFLDYDGTLTPLVDDPRRATLSAEAKRLLGACVRRRDTKVAIVSGRSLEDVKALVGDDRLYYAGNHGMEIEGPGLAPFRHPDLPLYQARLGELARKLETLARPGAWVERKGATLTFHYRGVPREEREALVARVREAIVQSGFQARGAHLAVEGRPPIGWDKGHAVLHIVRSLYGPAWSERVRVVYAGDDETDEDAFRILSGLGITFRVGRADTLSAATHRLPNVEAVHTLLRWVAKRPAVRPS